MNYILVTYYTKNHKSLISLLCTNMSVDTDKDIYLFDVNTTKGILTYQCSILDTFITKLSIVNNVGGYLKDFCIERGTHYE